MSSSIITLDVSGRKYRTSKATFLNSLYFKGLIARWSTCADKQEDGCYFVDADPDTFEHILNFMRHPTKFPLFWTKDAGLDYALYNSLEAQADFFLLDDLRDWIRSKRYLEAVKAVVETTSALELADMQNAEQEGADMQVQSFYDSLTARRPAHEPVGAFTQVFTRTVFDNSVCDNIMASSKQDGRRYQSIKVPVASK